MIKTKASITSKLALAYSLSIFITLLLSSLYLYWVLTNNMRASTEEFLQGEVNVIEHILNKPHFDINALKEELYWEPKELDYRYYARVTNAQGVTLIETPQMQPLFAATDFSHSEIKRLKLEDGHIFALTSVWMPSTQAKTQGHFIQVAYNITATELLISDYTRRLIFVIIITLFISTLLGIIIARRGLSSLHTVTFTLHRVSASQLKHHLTLTDLPKELVPIGLAFNAMIDRLEDSLRRLSDFSSNIAHELRTPIHILMGEAEISLARTRSTEEYKEIICSSLEEYGKLSAIIEKLLFIARAENHDLELCLENILVRQELENLCAFFQIIAEEKAITIACEGQAELCADSILFRRAVSNLLSNALHHTPMQGHIILNVETTDQGYVHISVTDSGCGISSEQLHKITDRFYSLDRARTKQHSGTGLGLAIVKSIMDLHQGQLVITSQIGIGSTVLLEFPLLNPG